MFFYFGFHCLLPIYSSKVNFYVLILNSVTFLNPLISSRIFFSGRFLGIVYIANHVICEQRQFYFFFANRDAFNLFFLPTEVTRTASNMLNKNGKSRYPCLIPDLRGKAFSILLLSLMLAIGFFVDGLYKIKEVLSSVY